MEEKDEATGCRQFLPRQSAEKTRKKLRPEDTNGEAGFTARVTRIGVILAGGLSGLI